MIADFHTRRIECGNYKLAIPLIRAGATTVPVEDDAFHGAAAFNRLAAIAVKVALIRSARKVAGKGPEPARHICPREEQRDGHRLIRRILRMPAIYSDGVARFAVVIGNDGRKLLQRYVGGKAVPLVVEPRFREEGIIIARANGVVPLPIGEFAALRLAVHQHLGYTPCVAFRLLEHRELIGIHRLIFMDAGLDVPACEIAAITARERACTKATHGDALPIAVINITDIARHPGILERKSQGPLPCGIWNTFLPYRY